MHSPLAKLAQRRAGDKEMLSRCSRRTRVLALFSILDAFSRDSVSRTPSIQFVPFASTLATALEPKLLIKK